MNLKLIVPQKIFKINYSDPGETARIVLSQMEFAIDDTEIGLILLLVLNDCP